MARVRVGILGCGTAAVPVCAAIAAVPETALGCVYDVNPEMARDLGERYHVPIASDLEALLGDPEVDAIYIAVPHHLLASLAQRVLEAGKHALVEKPMALDVAQADALIALAERFDLRLGVFYEMRYAPIYSQARELVQAGAPGKIFGVKVQTLINKPLSYWEVGYSGRSLNPWRGEKDKAGGGVTLMNTSHLLDALWYVTGLDILRLSAEHGTLVSKVQVEDTLAATFRFDNDAIGNLFAAAHIAGASGDERIEIYGTGGTLRLPDPYSQKPMLAWLNEPLGDIPPQEWYTLPHLTTNVFERAVQEFARAVQEHRPAPINGTDARRVLQTVLGMYRAADEQRVIRFDKLDNVFHGSHPEKQYETN